jgi:hypothetical protein
MIFADCHALSFISSLRQDVHRACCLCGCETLFRVRRRAQIENVWKQVLRGVSGPKGKEVTAHRGRLHNLCPALSAIIMKQGKEDINMVNMSHGEKLEINIQFCSEYLNGDSHMEISGLCGRVILTRNSRKN